MLSPSMRNVSRQLRVTCKLEVPFSFARDRVGFHMVKLALGFWFAMDPSGDICMECA